MDDMMLSLEFDVRHAACRKVWLADGWQAKPARAEMFRRPGWNSVECAHPACGSAPGRERGGQDQAKVGWLAWALAVIEQLPLRQPRQRKKRHSRERAPTQLSFTKPSDGTPKFGTAILLLSTDERGGDSSTGSS